jgi:hypothetical protein
MRNLITSSRSASYDSETSSRYFQRSTSEPKYPRRRRPSGPRPPTFSWKPIVGSHGDAHHFSILSGRANPTEQRIHGFPEDTLSSSDYGSSDIHDADIASISVWLDTCILESEQQIHGFPGDTFLARWQGGRS